MINAIYCSINEWQNQKMSYEGSDGATCSFQQFRIFTRPSFLDYLRAGWQISIVTAIDYTASNGNPSDRNSLHFLGPQN